MATYRVSRNIEASLVDYFTAQVATDWTNFNIRVEKNFASVYKGTLPCLCITVDDDPPIRRECASTALIQLFVVRLRIFATSDALRQDLKDWLLTKITNDFDYYAYTTSENINKDYVVSAKILSGKISIMNYIENRKEITNVENAPDVDKFRHVISFTVRVV